MRITSDSTTDFGFARHSVKGNLLDTCCGSFAYACPEVLRGEAYDGFASDVWSMGIILYAMFTCKLPYTEIDLKMLANGSSVQKLKFSQDTPRGNSVTKFTSSCSKIEI